MDMPKQPTNGHTILAEHYKSGQLRWFTFSSFQSIPNMYDNGVKVPRQGWVQIDPKKYDAPTEAMEAKAAKEAQAKAAKEAQAKAAAENSKDGGNKFESMKVPEILDYIKANGIEIEGVENLPKSEIIKILNSK
jgi:hypothetical protein